MYQLGTEQISSCLSTNEKLPSSTNQLLANEQLFDGEPNLTATDSNELTLTPAGNSGLTLTPAGNGELTLTPAGNGELTLTPTGHTSGTQRKQISSQGTRSNEGINQKKRCVHVIHREDSKQWVMDKLKPVLTELNIDMSTPDNDIPGKTIERAVIDSVKNAHNIIVVFSKLAIDDKHSKEHKWFMKALSRATHKDPDPLNITVIPVLHEDITHDNLPEGVGDLIPIKFDDPQFKSKIQRSIFYDNSHA